MHILCMPVFDFVLLQYFFLSNKRFGAEPHLDVL